jgi:hypothetical protein
MNHQSASPNPSKVPSSSISTCLNTLTSTAHSALGLFPTSPPKPASAPASSYSIQAPVTKSASNRSDPTTSAASIQNADAAPQMDQKPFYLSPYKTATWHLAGPSHGEKITPTKLTFNTNGALTSSPNVKTPASLSSPSETSAAKRSRDVQTTAPLPEEQIAKKPRLELLDQAAQNLVGNIMESLHGFEETNSLKGSTIAAIPPQIVNHPSLTNASNGGAVTQLDMPVFVGPIHRPGAVENSNQSETPAEEFSIHKTRTQPRKSSRNKAEAANAAAQALPVTVGRIKGSDTVKNFNKPVNPLNNSSSIPRPPNQARKTLGTKADSKQAKALTKKPALVPNPPSQARKTPDIKVKAAKAAKAAAQALPASLSPTSRSDVVKNSKQPKTSTKKPSSTPKPPNQRRNASGSKADIAKAADQSLRRKFAAQDNETVDDPERLGAPPQITEEKTRSAAKHAHTSSQSSTETISNKRAKTPTPERGTEVFYTPGKLGTERVSNHGAEISPPEVFYTPSKPSSESIGNNRAKTSTPEPAAEEFPTPSKVEVEVQIPAPKRAASELPPGTFEREGSPAKKLKNGGVSSSLPAPTNCTILSKGVAVKIPAAKRAGSELLCAGPFEREGPPAKKLKGNEVSPSSATPANRSMSSNGATHSEAGPQKRAPKAKTLKRAVPQATPRP